MAALATAELHTAPCLHLGARRAAIACFRNQEAASGSLAISNENGAAGRGRGCGGVGRVARDRPPTCVGGSEKSGPVVLGSAFSKQVT